MKKIIVPTDFSACANNAVRYAIQLARQSNAELIFFHSVYSIKDEKKWSQQFPAQYAKLHEEAWNKLQKNVFLQYSRLGIKPGKYTCVIKFGESFSNQLFELAKENKADLFVVGTHGAGKLKAALLGSNTSHVISNSVLPVLSVPATYKYTKLKELFYLADLKNPAGELSTLHLFSKQMKTKIVALFFDYGWNKSLAEWAAIKKLHKGAGLKVVKVSIDTPILESLKKHHKHRNSLICLFHDKKNAFQKFLTGNNAEEASMKLHFPILSLPRSKK